MTTRKRTYQTLFRRFTIFTLIIIGAFIAFFIWVQVSRYLERRRLAEEDREYTFTRYPDYGIWIPDQFQVHGIDVSRYQKRVNWRLVKSMEDRGLKLHFAFMKATEGTTLVDPQFQRNWRKSRESGLVRGAYHFFRQSSGGKEQAEHFLKQVKLSTGDLPPVLDVEVFKGDDTEAFVREIKAWLETVEAATGVRPIIYTYANFYNQHLAGRFENYPLWVAHYKNRISPRVYRNWHFWQHSESGRVNGINGFVDFNVFNGPQTSFDSLRIYQNTRINASSRGAAR